MESNLVIPTEEAEIEQSYRKKHGDHQIFGKRYCTNVGEKSKTLAMTFSNGIERNTERGIKY